MEPLVALVSVTFSSGFKDPKRNISISGGEHKVWSRMDKSVGTDRFFADQLHRFDLLRNRQKYY